MIVVELDAIVAEVLSLTEANKIVTVSERLLEVTVHLLLVRKVRQLYLLSRKKNKFPAYYANEAFHLWEMFKCNGSNSVL